MQHYYIVLLYCETVGYDCAILSRTAASSHKYSLPSCWSKAAYNALMLYLISWHHWHEMRCFTPHMTGCPHTGLHHITVVKPYRAYTTAEQGRLRILKGHVPTITRPDTWRFQLHIRHMTSRIDHFPLTIYLPFDQPFWNRLYRSRSVGYRRFDCL